MHTYIYDSFLGDKKHLPIVNQIESKITDLGLSGRICRLSPLRSLKDIVAEEMRRHPKTLIAVGNDSVVSQIISLIGGSKIPLGIIPVGEPNKIAEGLGITTENAANVLANRRILEMDLGVVDNKTFLKSAEIIGQKLRLTIDDNFIISTESSKVEVINFILNNEDLGPIKRPEPQSGTLNLVISKEKSGFLKKELEKSTLEFKRLTIETDEAEMLLDGFVKVSNPYEISLLPKGLSVIVGRNRSF